MNNLNELRDEIYDDAVAHGLWNEAEALRVWAYCGKRSKYAIDRARREDCAVRIKNEVEELYDEAHDEVYYTEELADVIIMALSVAGYLGIDIDKAVRTKMEINRGREWRHGK